MLMGSSSTKDDAGKFDELYSFGETRDVLQIVEEPNTGDVLIAYANDHSANSHLELKAAIKKGIYIGKWRVISCVETPQTADARSVSNSGRRSCCRLLLQNINDDDWKGWVIDARARDKGADKSCADTALMEYQAYVQGVADNYHLNGKNCQHFTEYCLNTGIGSSYPK